MLEVISKGFRSARQRMQGKIEISEDNIQEAISSIRVSLLEADVEYSVVKRFIDNIKEKAIGEIVDFRVKHKDKAYKLTPGDMFIKICQDELESFMGPADASINYNPLRPTIIMLVGLQGCGKTTTIAKLGSYLKDKGKSPLFVAGDVYRPAATQQLMVLGNQLSIPVFSEGKDPLNICNNAISFAKKNHHDIILFDTAGRLSIDEEMMKELRLINEKTSPDNIFMVCDAMVGQDAVTTAREFNNQLPVDGFIVTKLDGDSRGGAALSIKEVTGKPIKFLGMGEHLDSLEEFRPEGLATRILGMGDVVGLVQDFEKVIDEKKAEEDAKRMLKGKFTFMDFLEQIKMIKQMGPLQTVFEKMPGFSDMVPEGAVLDDRELVKVEAMINSMTKAERANPDLIKKTPSRMSRIAKGSGRLEGEVNELINKFTMMKNMMAKLGGSGLMGKIPGLSQLSKLKNLKNMDLSSMMGKKRAGINKPQVTFQSKEDREKNKNKRKREKKARKKGRR
ncbi:MAG: signal recognition particle protein [Pseudomonadota bacterium]